MKIKNAKSLRRKIFYERSGRKSLMKVEKGKLSGREITRWKGTKLEAENFMKGGEEIFLKVANRQSDFRY